MNGVLRVLLVVWLLAIATVIAATEHIGQVTFNGLPVPGATVIATQGERKLTTTTNQQGLYRFVDLADGTWSMRVEMLGFQAATRDVTIPGDGMPVTWTLQLLPFDEIAKTAVAPAPLAPAAANATAGRNETAPSGASPAPGGTAAPRGFQRADVNAAPRTAARPAAVADDPAPPPAEAASDGLLINGSVNNGAASPFAQPAAFGNNRRRPGALYTGRIGLLAGTSALDGRPFSFTGRDAPRQDYNDLHWIGLFQGPIKIPGVVQKRPNLFVGYQRTDNHNATTAATIVPTLLERSGDFSQTTNALGNQVRIVDPRTGQPFAGNAIPADRLSPQALSLLQYYPLPNVTDDPQFNYQTPILTRRRQDSLQTRVTQPINNRNQLLGTASYQRTATDTRGLFGFDDESRVSTMAADTTWTHRFNQFFTLRPRFQFTQSTTATTPYFANRTNVSGDAGIAGNNQEPANWGPPTLTFVSGIEPLNDLRPAFTRSGAVGGGAEAMLSHGRHFFTFGGDLRRQYVDINAQQDPRGRLSFSGALTGADFADFLLGVPQTSAIATGNADKAFRAWTSDAYITDDYRVSPSLTLNLGVRWEFEAPMHEKLGRLVNLAVTPDFSAATPVIGGTLLRRDFKGIQPRTALAWRPIPGSSVVVRAGYGIYRNAAVYEPIATLLAQQPPFSQTFSVSNNLANPLTLAAPFDVSTATSLNTYAVDPDFRVGYAHNWQASVQRDLPASLTVTASYLGTRGEHLPQAFLPNTYAPGAANPCPTCPIGFTYLTSTGHSTRHAAQLQVRRRLRNGLTWTTQYTLAKAEDDAATLTTATLAAASIAQDWRNLDAEWGPSSFDQRHLLTVTAEYTTGVGVRGGGLLTGIKGAILKGWTFSGQMTTGSGMPFTPIYLTSLPGTGTVGTIRGSLTGVSTDAIPDGAYVNPAAYAPPAPGTFGTAGRNSLRGPRQFTLNGAVTRSFPWGGTRTWDFRLEAINLLNRRVYSSINTLVGSSQFGLPNNVNPPRTIQTSAILRF